MLGSGMGNQSGAPGGFDGLGEALKRMRERSRSAAPVEPTYAGKEAGMFHGQQPFSPNAGLRGWQNMGQQQQMNGQKWGYGDPNAKPQASPAPGGQSFLNRGMSFGRRMSSGMGNGF